MDKELATKLLGFRDAEGKLVCPADVVDPSKPYTVYLVPRTGIEPPSKAVVGRIGEAFKALGFKGSIQLEDHKGGQAFLNKRGDVVCRLVEAKEAPKPKPKPTKAAEEVSASDSTTVEVTKAPPKKKTGKKTKKKTKK
jgi:hypothetical protein